MREVVYDARRALSHIPGVVALDGDNLGCEMDPLKLTIFVPESGTTGTQIPVTCGIRASASRLLIRTP